MFVALCLFQVFCHSSAAVLVILMVSCMIDKSLPYECIEDRPECYDSDGDGIVDSEKVSAEVAKLCSSCGDMWRETPGFRHCCRCNLADYDQCLIAVYGFNN